MVFMSLSPTAITDLARLVELKPSINNLALERSEDFPMPIAPWIATEPWTNERSNVRSS
jgi:hypothetical protein